MLRMEEKALIVKKNDRRCLACGTTENMGRRLYCSPYCRQKLAYKLDIRVGLMQVLGVRFATFYFSETTITMDMLLYSEKSIFRFCYPRSFGKKPADDFSSMANLLGYTWWDEKERTKKRFMASDLVLAQAQRCDLPISSVRPVTIQIPSIRSEYLARMNINKNDLTSMNETRIKSTYRVEAKKRHPDVGGNPEKFRELHHAYKALLLWVSNPQYITRMGFPDKWLYSGETNRWVSPQPRLIGAIAKTKQ